MNGPLRLIKGSPGKPLHPPLTDASIGAYTAGVAMLVLGAAGVEEEQMAHGSLLAISFGLLVAPPTAITGLLDWLDLPKDTPVRRVATIHMLVMITTTVLFALTWLAQLNGYKDDEIKAGALVVGLIAFAFLAAGGNIGGANVFVYGVRVLKRDDIPVAKALNPLGVDTEPPPQKLGAADADAAPGARSDTPASMSRGRREPPR
jgi:uncharacterized membrane protein